MHLQNSLVITDLEAPLLRQLKDLFSFVILLLSRLQLNVPPSYPLTGQIKILL